MRLPAARRHCRPRSATACHCFEVQLRGAHSCTETTYQTAAEAAAAALCRAAAESNLPEPAVSRHDEWGRIVCAPQRCTYVKGPRDQAVQCSLFTEHGQFCPAHLDSEMGLRIGASNVPNAGLGLHATRDFESGAHVSPLTGNLLLNLGERKEWQPLSGYVGLISGKAAIDAAPTNAAPARLINASTGTGFPSNCKLVPSSKSIRVETTRAVAAGQEFLTAYSAGYWRKTPHFTHGSNKSTPVPAKPKKLAAGTSLTAPAPLFPGFGETAASALGFDEQPDYLLFLGRHLHLCRPSNLEVRAVRDLSARVMLNNLQPCQLGVFATEAIDTGVKLCLYSACWRDPTPADRERQNTHLKRIFNSSSILDGEVTAALFQRYTLATHSLDAICALPAADFEPTGLSPAQLERFKTVMPIGCMVNTVRKRVDSKGEALIANCAWIDMGVKQEVQHGSMEVLTATRPIRPGDELLVESYKNKDEQREFSFTPVPSPHLARQAALLRTFAEAEVESYRDFRYLAWTSPSTQVQMPLRLASSPHLPDTVGVFPDTKQCPPHALVAAYSDSGAVLMWEEQHDRFNQHYHCPTAVSVPLLDYFELDHSTALRMGLKNKGPKGWRVQVVLVGDPTCVGATINSPLNLKVRANCQIRVCKAQDLHLYLRAEGHKKRVSSDVMCVWRTSTLLRGDVTGVELLLSYDGAGASEETDLDHNLFWKPLITEGVHNPYCDICFEKHDKPRVKANQLFICSGACCTAARHLACFSDNSWRLPDWFCPPCSKKPHKPMGIIARLPLTCCATPPQLLFPPAASDSPPPPASNPPPSHVASTPPAAPTPSVPSNLSVLPAASTVPQKLAARLDASARPPVRSMTAVPVVKAGTGLADRSLSSPAPSFSSSPALSQVPTSTPAVRRPAPLSVLSKKQLTGKLSAFSVPSDKGKRELREMWMKWGPIIRKAVPRAGWLLRYPVAPRRPQDSDLDMPREIKKFTRLLFEFDCFKLCCGSAFSGAGGRFHEPHQLLEARFEFENKWKFDNVVLSQLRCEQLKNSPSALQWQGVPVCPSCYCLASGTGRSALFSSLKPNCPVVLSRPKPQVEQIVPLLEAFIRNDSQFNPNHGFTSDSDGNELTIHVLPDTTRRQAKQRFEADLLQNTGKEVNDPDWFSIPLTTFGRCLEWLEQNRYIRVNMKESKDMAKCHICISCQNHIRSARQEWHRAEAQTQANKEKLQVARLAYHNHTNEWQEQRDHFTDRKMEALRAPWLLWTITLDGMDCSKTKLPRYFQENKDPATAYMLEHRVVGAFCFGGPVLCMGISSFDDVNGKGGCASVTGIESILNQQWTSMNPKRIARIPSASDPSVPASTLDPSGRVDFSWPDGCHFTFDNTTGDNKNAVTFRFFAALVFYGVFNYITVSNLMVGHTHDIVDQMFSVWSRTLDKHDAPSLQSMHKWFRDEYESKIYELKSHLQKAKHGDLSERVIQLAALLGVHPRLMLQELVVDADAWCHKEIKYMSSAHCFYFVQEQEVVSEHASGAKLTQPVVAMYSRHFAKSTDNKSVHHNPEYAKIAHGPWSARTVVMRQSDAPRGDPFACPPRVVENIDKIRLHIDRRRDPKGLNDMSDEQHREFSELLDKFERNFDKLREVCEECAMHMQELKKIGPISNKDGMSAEQKEFASKQTRAKHERTKLLSAHMKDSKMAEKHVAFRAVGWWTKWLNRVRDTIRPYYLSRGLVSDEPSFLHSAEASLIGRQHHPSSLPGNEHLRHHRVDVSTFAKVGPPQAGHYVVARGDSAIEPIWVGRLLPDTATHIRAPASVKSKAKVATVSVAVTSSSARRPPARSAATAASARNAAVAADSNSEVPPRRTQVSASFTDDSPLSFLQPSIPASVEPTVQQEDEEMPEPGDDEAYEEEARGPDAASSAAASSAAASSAAAASSSNISGLHKRRYTSKDAAVTSKSSRTGLYLDAPTSARTAVKYKVHWLERVDNKALHALAAVDWVAEMEKQDKETPDSKSLECWQAACEQFKQGTFAPLPKAAIELHRNIRYTELSHGEPLIGEVHQSQLVVWGDKLNLFKSDWTLQKRTFDKVQEDLCEIQDRQHNMSINHKTAYA